MENNSYEIGKQMGYVFGLFCISIILVISAITSIIKYLKKRGDKDEK